MNKQALNRREFLGTMAGAVAVGAIGAAPMSGAASNVAKAEGAMPKRVLGKTGVEVSILALGGVIGMQLPPSEDHDPTAIAETALNLGVNYFDTAPSYNNGRSEKNYGQVLARRRQEVFLACKTHERSYDGTLRSVEQSLKHLRTDRFDLLQIHGVSGGEDVAAWGKPDGVYTALQTLREQKVTRFIGITGHDSAEILGRAIAMYEFDTLLTTLNPVPRRRAYREALLRLANEKEMGVIAMKVMGGGNGCLVTGNPLQQVLRPYHDDAPRQMEARSLIRYTLGLPVSVAVIGVDSISQLQANTRIVKEAQPMRSQERGRLERAMS